VVPDVVGSSPISHPVIVKPGQAGTQPGTLVRSGDSRTVGK
jgi:hypothetical protein